MISSFLKHKWFFAPYLAAIFAGCFFLVRFTRSEIHIWINQFHSGFFDTFFRYITNLGDGIFLPVFLAIMLLIRFRESILLVIVFLLSGLVVQILKRLFFQDVARPAKYFEGNHSLYFVPGVENYCCNSFPSGHSATAFSVFLVFAMVTRYNWLKLTLFVLASLVAFSRVYLSQHFLADIIAGSFIGVMTVIGCYPVLASFQKNWLNENILTITGKKG
jgi:membrane-associated phospholipid phosphatase